MFVPRPKKKFFSWKIDVMNLQGRSNLKNTLSPDWKTFSLPVTKLCNGDYDRSVEIVMVIKTGIVQFVMVIMTRVVTFV